MTISKRQRQLRQQLLLQVILVVLLLVIMMIVWPEPVPESKSDLSPRQRAEVVARWR